MDEPSDNQSIPNRRTAASVLVATQLLGDSLSVVLSFWLGWASYRLLGFAKDPRSLEFYLAVSIPAAIVMIAVYERLGLYKPQVSVLNIREHRAVIHGTLVGGVTFLALSFYFRDRDGRELSRLIISFSFVWLVGLASLFRMVLHKALEAGFRRGTGCRRILIYGAGGMGRQLLRRLSGCPELGFFPVGFVDDRTERQGILIQGQTGKSHTRVKVLGTGESLPELVRTHSVDEVFIAVPGAGTGRVRRIFESCRKAGVEYRFVPHLYGLFFQELQIDTFDGMPLVRHRELLPQPIYDLVKRLFDIVFALVALVITAPVLVIAGWLIRRDSAGPALFAQDRVGKNGRSFRMYKMRTMYIETPQYEFHPKRGDDPRLTRLGRWLRRFSLDELPQFVNVLLGDMSVVGPRPEMPFIVDRYSAEQRIRLKVKPGITGLWQISADRSRMIHQNLDYDLFYVFNRGFLLDLVIILETVFSVVRGVGAR